ncbi:hypothetical protein D3C85_580550 [compost metagenome]
MPDHSVKTTDRDLAHATRFACPRRCRLRHRHHRIRHHGSFARCRPRPQREHSRRRITDHRLRPGRGVRCTDPRGRHRQHAAQGHAVGHDADVHPRQHALRAGAKLRHADGRARDHGTVPRRIFRHRFGGGRRAGGPQQKGSGDCHDVHRPDPGQRARRATGYRTRAIRRLALDLLGGVGDRGAGGDCAMGLAAEKHRDG